MNPRPAGAPRVVWDADCDGRAGAVVRLPFARVVVARTQGAVPAWQARWARGGCRWLLEAAQAAYPTVVGQGRGRDALLAGLDLADRRALLAGRPVRLSPDVVVVGSWDRWPDVALFVTQGGTTTYEVRRAGWAPVELAGVR